MTVSVPSLLMPPPDRGPWRTCRRRSRASPAGRAPGEPDRGATLAADYEHPTPHGGRCRARIYAPEEQEDTFVVICTELRNNPGQSVTNAAEDIAGGVVLQHALPTSRTVFIEHYESGGRGNDHDPHTFDLLIFSNTDPESVLRAGVWSVELGEPS